MKQNPSTGRPKREIYARHFSSRERAALSDLYDPTSLDPEVALLRLLIQRELAPPSVDESQNGYLAPRTDVWKIIQYVHTLCRLVKARGSTPSALHGEASDALKEILDELRHAASSEEEEEEEGEPSRTLGTPTPGQRGLRPPVDHLPSHRAGAYCHHSHRDLSVSSVTSLSF